MSPRAIRSDPKHFGHTNKHNLRNPPFDYLRSRHRPSAAAEAKVSRDPVKLAPSIQWKARSPIAFSVGVDPVEVDLVHTAREVRDDVALRCRPPRSLRLAKMKICGPLSRPCGGSHPPHRSACWPPASSRSACRYLHRGPRSQSQPIRDGEAAGDSAGPGDVAACARITLRLGSRRGGRWWPSQHLSGPELCAAVSVPKSEPGLSQTHFFPGSVSPSLPA